MPNFGFDKWIDAQLRNVPLPPDFLSRLADGSASSAPGAADARLDAVLRNVSVPPYLEARLLRIARQRRATPLWLRVSLAASIFLVLGVGAAGYVGLITGTLLPSEPMFATTATSADAASPLDSRTRPANETANSPNLAADAQNLAADPLVERLHGVDQNLPETSPKAVSLPLAENLGKLGASFQQALEAHRRSQAALGAGGDFARLPSLDAWELPLAHGLAPPVVPGYDLLFQLKHGEHPFVSPAANPALLRCSVPLTFRTASYDLALRTLTGGTLPSAEEIRVEDFLAAQAYRLPPAPADEVALQAAASPSPLGAKGLYLLQLAVQAGPKKEMSHPPTRLVVVVDTSAAMLSGARWETVARGLTKLATHMAPADRLTLVGFAEKSRVLAENMTQDALRALLAAGTLPRPAGSANLADAIRSASEVVRTVASGEARRVVFITSGREAVDDLAAHHAGRALADLADAKIPWQIIRMSHDHGDPQWSELAEQGHGEISKATSAAEIHQSLLRKLTGRFATVAGGATLKLRFNPEVVTSYRLLGHESATLTATSDRLEIDLAADDTATGLFEMWIKPKGDQLAVAELTWRDPANGQQRGKPQPIFRSDVSPSFSQAPTWFQQGVIAAKTAEALRGSFYAPNSHPFGKILELAEQVDSSAAEQADFRNLIQLVKQADKRR